MTNLQTSLARADTIIVITTLSGGDYEHSSKVLWHLTGLLNGRTRSIASRFMLEPGNLHLAMVIDVVLGHLGNTIGIPKLWELAGVSNAATTKLVLAGKRLKRARAYWCGTRLAIMGSIEDLFIASTGTGSLYQRIEEGITSGETSAFPGVCGLSPETRTLYTQWRTAKDAWLLKLREDNKSVDFVCLLFDLHKLGLMLRLNMRTTKPGPGGIVAKIKLLDEIIVYLARFKRHKWFRILAVCTYQVKTAKTLFKGIWKHFLTF